MADLLQQVYNASPRIETKSEYLDYFQGNTRRAAEYGIEQGAFVNKNGEPIKLASAMRRFQTRGGKSQGENSPVYKGLGQTLPPKSPPPGGYHIEGTVYMKFSEGECEEREVNEDITGEEAEEFLRQANADMKEMLVRHYMEDALYDEPSARTEGCKEPKLTVTPIE